MNSHIPERIPVTHLDHVALRVPDPPAAAAYYRRVLGMAETGRGAFGGAIRLSAWPHHANRVAAHEIVLYPGETSALDHYALAVPDTTALAQAVVMLRARGVEVDGPRAFEAEHGPAARLRDVDGELCELTPSVAPVARPEGRAPYELVKLSHVNLKSPDPARGARWWETVMDFRLSDYIPETFYWLRCNDEHTTVALVRSTGPGLHHIGFEIGSWHNVRLLLDHLFANEVRVEYGPGRHGPGNSVFVYFVDPWGVRWEMLCEMTRIEDDATHQPGVWDPTKGRLGAVNLWGPAPPESFIRP